MHVRTGLLAFCVVVLAGCARDRAPDAAGQGAQAAASSSVPTASAVLPASARAPRVASLPDRGELATYPGRVQRPDGAYTWFRSDISEAHALRSIAEGHLRLTTPEGQLLDVRFDRHVEHPSGDWTWIGHLPGEESAQTIITFGERAVFGSIAQPGGKPPLRLTMRDGVSWLVETDPRKVAAIVNAATRPTHPDYHIVKRADLPAAGNPRPAGAPIVAPAGAPIATSSAATASAATTVDLLVGYTSGFVTAQGSASAALTRLNYLVDVANAAYANSQINAQVRLVHAMQVSYTDLNTNDLALEQLSGYHSDPDPTKSGPVTPNAAFDALRAARETYGADLVTLVRPFKDPEQDSCGLAWLLGGGKQGIQAGQGWDDLAYSVIGDGEDVGSDGHTYFCRDETLAHEMGHNEGSAHDRQTAAGDDGVLDDPDDYGAFQYSFGYKTTSTTGNFYTVMAYGDTGQTPYRVFSNPRITFCGGRACGTTTFEDNARSLGQTIPVVTGFRATKVPLGMGASYDFNGDGVSDVFWRNTSDGRDTIWKSANSATPQAVTTANNLDWVIKGVGDFDGDGKADVLWRNLQDGRNSIWKSANSATPQAVTTINNLDWVVAGVGDFDGDGKDDILWRNNRDGRDTIWKSANSATPQAVTTANNFDWIIAGVGDFDGDGKADILWRNLHDGRNSIWRSANSATPQTVTTINNLDWAADGIGDFDGDGKADILWRNLRDGRNSIWRSANSATPLAVTTASNMDWVIALVGDFNGDGKADILWRNLRDGRNSIWRSANSATPQAVTTLNNLAWKIVR
jgi:hypothetical protein